MTVWSLDDYRRHNEQINRDNEIRQAAFLQQLRDREALDLQRRQTQILEQRHNQSGGLLLLLFLGLIVGLFVGVLWLLVQGLWWLGIVVYRRLRGKPTDAHDRKGEAELLDLLRREGVSPSDVKAGIEETLRRRGRR